MKEGITDGKHTVTPDLRDLDLWLRGDDGRERRALQLGFDEESSDVVGRRQLLCGGDVGGVGRPGPFAAPVVGCVFGVVVGLSLGERLAAGGE